MRVLICSLEGKNALVGEVSMLVKFIVRENVKEKGFNGCTLRAVYFYVGIQVIVFFLSRRCAIQVLCGYKTKDNRNTCCDVDSRRCCFDMFRVGLPHYPKAIANSEKVIKILYIRVNYELPDAA